MSGFDQKWEGASNTQAKRDVWTELNTDFTALTKYVIMFTCNIHKLPPRWWCWNRSMDHWVFGTITWHGEPCQNFSVHRW